MWSIDVEKKIFYVLFDIRDTQELSGFLKEISKCDRYISNTYTSITDRLFFSVKDNSSIVIERVIMRINLSTKAFFYRYYRLYYSMINS